MVSFEWPVPTETYLAIINRAPRWQVADGGVVYEVEIGLDGEFDAEGIVLSAEELPGEQVELTVLVSNFDSHVIVQSGGDPVIRP